MSVSTPVFDQAHLMSEWDYERNERLGIDLTTITAGGNTSVWWKCRNGHSWQDTVIHRISGRNCPYCSSHRLLPGYNDLATRNPVLAAEWHPTLNGNLSPSEVFPRTNTKVWWQCEQGHAWNDTVNHRNSGRNCPYCSGKRLLVGYNDLETVNPDLSSEWHPTLNEHMTPQMVFANSGHKVWWKCALGHEWAATISSRNRGNGCPICSKEQNTSFPEQAVFFYIKQLYADSISRYVDRGNELDIYIPSIRTGIEYDGMRYHTSKSVLKENRKDSFFAQKGIVVIRIKETSEAGDIAYVDGRTVYYSPKKRYAYFEKAMQQLIILLSHITGVAVCNVEINIERDASLIYRSYLSMLKESSVLANPRLSAEWNYKQNHNLNPQYVHLNSGKKVWWICEKGHEWQAVVASRNRGCGCPFCAHQKVLKGFSDLATLQPRLAKEWHPTRNGELTPNDILPSTAQKVWWLCSRGHEWLAAPNDRTNGNGCPYCANQIVIPGENDLKTKEPTIAAEWHPTKNGTLEPCMFLCGSGKKVWWKCKEGHEWQATIYSRGKGSRCPTCQIMKRSIENSKGINVYMVSDLSYVGTYRNARSLCEFLGIDYQKQMGNIASVCRRKQKTLMRKYVLRYVDDDELMK